MTTAEYGILIAALGFMVTIVTLIVRLTSTLTRVDVTMKNLGEKITDINCENKHEHDDLFGIAREHTDKLENHAIRIKVLEEKPLPAQRKRAQNA
ncbi:MAG: hypothetical protein WC374_12380 [Phycisphaerae bacterium]|jgi:hypothetical protein